MAEFGTVFITKNARTLGERVRRAEAAGFSWIGIGDTQSLFREMYVCLTVAALNTEKARIGPMVTNPVTRHPGVTASAMATLDELTGGRTFLGLGTGDTALVNLGQRPATVARLRRYITAVKGLLAGEEVEWDGGMAHTRWSRRQIPILLAAEGPRILRLAGEVAEGAVVHVGMSPDIVLRAFETAKDGAREAGRDPAALELSVHAKVNINDDPKKAVEELGVIVAASRHAFRHNMESKDVPPELEGAVRSLVEGYQTAQHEPVNPALNAQLAERLGLSQFLAERFAIAGTPEQCRQQVQGLLDAGVTRFLINAVGAPDPDRVLERFGKEVIAKVR